MASKTVQAIRGTSRTLKLPIADLFVQQFGSGAPVLWLHSEDYYELDLPLIQKLAQKYKVIVPWMPGYGKTDLPETVRTVDDLSYAYLDLMQKLKLEKVRVVGFSMGGWLANEIASKDCSRISKMSLVCPLGVKIGGAYDRDIQDIYYHQTATVQGFKFSNPKNDPMIPKELSEEEAFVLARAKETTAKLAWDPYFHNPTLKYRLHRVTAKTQFVWGARDGLAKPKYGRAYAKLLPKSEFVSVPGAGHFPHVEKPDSFDPILEKFLR